MWIGQNACRIQTFQQFSTCCRELQHDKYLTNAAAVGLLKHASHILVVITNKYTFDDGQSKNIKSIPFINRRYFYSNLSFLAQPHARRPAQSLTTKYKYMYMKLTSGDDDKTVSVFTSNTTGLATNLHSFYKVKHFSFVIYKKTLNTQKLFGNNF